MRESILELNLPKGGNGVVKFARRFKNKFLQLFRIIHGKNDFAERFKILLDVLDQKINFELSK